MIPLNLVGDFGGGGLMLAFGMACALFEARGSGRGQVVDAAMVDGASTLMTSMYSAFQAGFWQDQRGVNMLDSGSHFYEVYETKNNKFISLGAIEPQFYSALLDALGDDATSLTNQFDMANWPQMKDQLAEIIKNKTRDEWDAIMAGKDICYAPVLSMAEVQAHPHNKSRATYIEKDGIYQPGPAPRFSRTKAEIKHDAVLRGQHTNSILQELGYTEAEINRLLEEGVVACVDD